MKSLLLSWAHDEQMLTATIMLQIYTIPAFEDNYFWLIQPSAQDPSAYIVDPGQAAPVIEVLDHYGLTLKGILITHHHHDHKDGALELSQRYKIPIYGPDSAKIPQVTHTLGEGDKVQLGALTARVMLLPGHTLDHIGYYLDEGVGTPRLFSGDTLFAAGCGRLFDGSAAQLCQSLQRIARLPDNTLIYCAHEYTLTNIRFALSIEPDNGDIAIRQTQEMQKRQQSQPTIPSSLLLEKRTNPFLRCHLPQVKRQVEQLTKRTLVTECDIFTEMRRLKDQF